MPNQVGNKPLKVRYPGLNRHVCSFVIFTNDYLACPYSEIFDRFPCYGAAYEGPQGCGV